MTENIHDKFFKDNFSRQDIALAFIEEVFPETLLSQLDLGTFALSANSYVDPILDEYFADIVYTCIYRRQQTVEVSILFEHKSKRYAYPHFQLLRYLLNSWEQARKQKQPPTLIIPVVIYHGRTRWHYQPLASYFSDSIPNELSRFLPEFDYLLFDISHYPDEQLLSFRNKFLATSLFLMKHRENEKQLLAQRESLFSWLEELIETEAGKNYLTATIVYLFKNLDFRSRDFYYQLFVTPGNRQKVMTTYDYLIEEGVQKGLLQGKIDAFTALLQVAHQQGIDIAKLAAQYTDLPAENVQAIVDRIKKGIRE